VPEAGWTSVDGVPEPKRLVVGLDRLRAEPFFQDLRASVLGLVDPEPEQRVIDIGCGTGEDTGVLAGRGCLAVGVDLSTTMLREARRRHPGVPFVAADARHLPFPGASTRAVMVNRLLQHLPGAPGALAEWHWLLNPGGRLVICEPDLTTAAVEGLDTVATAAVLNWRASTRAGLKTVHDLPNALRHAGFAGVSVEPRVLELSDLTRADGIMGLAEWGRLASESGALSSEVGTRWRGDVENAWRRGRLRYSCTYLLGTAHRE
jgi:trans-aconitate methyltransferase